jgi:hypothetical protein
MKWIAFALFSAGLLAMTAQAQVGSYPVKSLDFDLWCTEEEHLPYERCDKHLPDDVKKFEAYRAVIERYEIPYLQQRDEKLRFDRDIMHADPVDKSVEEQTQPPKATDGKSP